MISTERDNVSDAVCSMDEGLKRSREPPCSEDDDEDDGDDEVIGGILANSEAME